MIIVYKLSMPNVGSWNGKWTGEGNLYALVRSYSGKTGNEKAKRILKGGSYYYRWPDGWGASVSVEQVDSRTASKIRRASKGFRGYDWMVSSIEKHGDVYASLDEIPETTKGGES